MTHHNAGVFAEAQNDGLQFHPPPHNHRYSIPINQNVVTGSPIFHALCVTPIHNATEDDSPHNITYGIISTTNTFVTVNSMTGVVSLTVDARDLPGRSPLTPILYCKYANIESSTATVELRIHYRIENEHVPTFTHDDDQTLDLWVREDHIEREGPVIVCLNVTDGDLEPCNIVTFAILSGNSDGNFRIGSDNGVLELTKNLNYDYSHRRYNLTIRATNTRCGDRRYSDEIIVHVYVIDIDDEHLTFEQHMHIFTFDEQQQPRNFVQLRCLDPDTAGTQIVYEEDFASGENPFMINHQTGYVSAIQPLDYELQTSYHLAFTCYDILNSSIRDTAVVKVLINPINEFLPEIRESFAYIPINYTSPVGTLLASAANGSRALFSIIAMDRDHGLEHGNIHFMFAESNDYYDYFHLDALSGDLTLIRQFDFDVCSEDARHIRSLRIIVCDTLKDEDRLQSCPTIVILVAISSPSCSLTFFRENYTIDVPESTEIGSELLEVGCEVPGRRTNNTSLQQTIETFSPDPKLLRTLRIEGDHVILQETLDYESIHQFTIYLRCSNTDGQESIASLVVHVLPENDNSPYFQSSLYTFRTSAEMTEVLPATIGQVTAMDDDQGMVNNLTYSLAHNQGFDSVNDWSIYFTFSESENGTVSILMVNHPMQENLIVVFDIIVSDGDNSAQSSILVYIPDGAKTAISTTLSAEQCGLFCIALVLILFALMMIVITAILATVCICYSRRLKQKHALSNGMELQERKSNMMQQYSSLQRNDIQPESGMSSEAGQLL